MKGDCQAAIFSSEVPLLRGFLALLHFVARDKVWRNLA
jgi:hypothetical protein